MFDWIVANAEGIIAILIAGHGVALAIVNLTPTPADDAIVGKVYKFIEFLAGVVSRKAKEYPGEAEDLKAMAAELDDRI